MIPAPFGGEKNASCTGSLCRLVPAHPGLGCAHHWARYACQLLTAAGLRVHAENAILHLLASCSISRIGVTGIGRPTQFGQ